MIQRIDHAEILPTVIPRPEKNRIFGTQAGELVSCGLWEELQSAVRACPSPSGYRYKKS